MNNHRVNRHSVKVIDAEGETWRHPFLVKLAEQQDWLCCHCGHRASPHIGRPDTATIEHLVLLPIDGRPSKHRNRVPRNPSAKIAAACAMACRRCNGSRGRRALPPGFATERRRRVIGRLQTEAVTALLDRVTEDGVGP